MSNRKFGITTKDQDYYGGIIVNNVTINHNTDVAQARDQYGKVIDYAVYSLEDQITINGLYTNVDVSPGTVIVVNDVNYLITSVEHQEENTTFQTGSLRAIHYPRYTPPEQEKIPLTFKGLSSTNIIRLSAVNDPTPIMLKAKINDGDWNSVTVDQNTYYTALLNQGDTIAFSGANEYFSTNNTAYYNFAMTGQIEAGGNIQSLMNYSPSADSHCYRGLFYGCSALVKAPDLSATTLAPYCYDSMFSYCTSLTAAPQLPALTMENCCYRQMFRYCSSLVIPPQLPATSLASSCYSEMFEGCINLSTAYDLPAKTLAYQCYNGMYKSCSSLIDAPVISASTTSKYSCNFMFLYCNSLTSINVNFTSWRSNISGNDGGKVFTQNWISSNGMSSTGTFYKPSTLPEEYADSENNYSKIPSGWTVVNK